MVAHRGYGWMTRPVVLIVIALIIITIVLSVRGITKNKIDRQKNNVVGNRGQSEDQEASEGGATNPLISFPFSVILFVLFIWASYQAIGWPETVNEFPIMSAVLGSALVFFTIYFDGRKAIKEIRFHGDLPTALLASSEKAGLERALIFFGYLIAMILVMLVIGQKFALPLFIFAYLLRWGNYNWRLSFGYAAGGWLVLVVFYDRTLNFLWYPSWLSTWLPELLPSWVPYWLFV